MTITLLESDEDYLTWRKPARSVNAGNCTEVASAAGVVSVRDSKDPDTLVLRYTARSWREFLFAARAGALDSLG
jgi:hypothetical protein